MASLTSDIFTHWVPFPLPGGPRTNTTLNFCWAIFSAVEKAVIERKQLNPSVLLSPSMNISSYQWIYRITLAYLEAIKNCVRKDAQLGLGKYKSQTNKQRNVSEPDCKQSWRQ